MARQMVGAVLTVPLTGGATLNIWSDHLEAGGPVFLMRDLTNAGVVTLPAAHRGQPDRVAVGVWTRHSHYAFFVPADSADAPRAVEAIYQTRPDLRAHGLPRGVAVHGAAGMAPRVAALGEPHERLVAGVAHLSGLFLPLLLPLPLILWCVNARRSPYAARQARQAFLFQLGILVLDALIIVALLATSAGSLIGAVASGNPAGLGIGVLVILVGGLALVVMTLFGLGCSLFAAIETFQGRPFSYPFMRRL